MIKKTFLMIFIGLLSVMSSCDNNPVAHERFTNYFPLQIGNEWTFQFPVWTPSSGDTLTSLDYKIIKKKEVNGKEYYGFNRRMPFFPHNRIIEGLDTIFVRQNESGDIMLLADSTEYLYFVFTLEEDTLVRSEIKEVRYFYATESINETVDTPIGKFQNCYIIFNYFPQIKGTEHRIYFAPGYGPVKIYYPEMSVTYQLVGINIQNK